MFPPDKPYVIAEFGANHCGSEKLLAKMVIEASKAGASAIKIQKRDNKTLYTEDFYNRPYNSENAFGATYGEHREALELHGVEINKLRDWTENEGMDFGATAFDIPSVTYMEENCPPDFYKVASGDLCNEPLQHAIAATGRPIVFSTGGATSIEPVVRAYERLSANGSRIACLHCTSAYPAPYNKLNLRSIEEIREHLPEAVPGWSSHARGINQAPTAYALGARVFEFHFTLDRYLKGTDQAFSLEPEGLATVVRYLGFSAEAMGRAERYRDGIECAPLKKQWKNGNGQIDGNQTDGGYVEDLSHGWDAARKICSDYYKGLAKEEALEAFGFNKGYPQKYVATFPKGYTLPRDWGYEKVLETENYSLKKICMYKGEKGGLQVHRVKDEAGIMIEGQMRVTYDPGTGLTEKVCLPGDFFHFPAESVHQAEALTDVVYVEASTPHFNDRVHVERYYGRRKEDGGLPSTKPWDIRKTPIGAGLRKPDNEIPWRDTCESREQEDTGEKFKDVLRASFDKLHDQRGETVRAPNRLDGIDREPGDKVPGSKLW